MSTANASADVIVVGAGLAGLVCAHDLGLAGYQCTVLEGSDGVGGRVRTDLVDGFRLDRGFQIVSTNYPQVIDRLDLDALAVGTFAPGALVRVGNQMHRVADPLRQPRQLWSTLRAPVGTFADRVRLLRLVVDVRTHSVVELLRRPDTSTSRRLTDAGFTPTMIELLWRPLFAGIQLDPDLEVSRRRFDVILRMLASGRAGVPRLGMGAIPEQLAAKLPADSIRLGATVRAIDGTTVELADGERQHARAVVVATDGPAAHRLLGSNVADPGSRAVACCWFSTTDAPWTDPVIALDGTSEGPARNLAVLTHVSRSYAPPGVSLIAAAVPGADALDPSVTARVRAQLASWFGSTTNDWTHLRTDVIAHGQPDQRPPLHPRQRVNLGDGVFVCGDHRDTASIQGAMFSGERTATAVAAHLAAG